MLTLEEAFDKAQIDMKMLTPLSDDFVSGGIVLRWQTNQHGDDIKIEYHMRNNFLIIESENDGMTFFEDEVKVEYGKIEEYK